MDFSRLIGFGFEFASDKRRISIQFIWNAVVLAAFALPLIMVMPFIRQFMQVIAVTSDVSAAFAAIAPFQAGAVIAGAVLLFVAIIILFWFPSLFVHGFFVHQALNPSAETNESVNAVKKRYSQFILAVILVALVSVVQGIVFSYFKAIPVAGVLFSVLDAIISIFLGFAFIYVLYYAMSGKPALDSVKHSVALFLKKPVETLVASLLAFIFGALIFLFDLLVVAAAMVAWAQAGFPYNGLAFLGIGLVASIAVLIAAFAQLFGNAVMAGAFTQLTDHAVASHAQAKRVALVKHVAHKKPIVRKTVRKTASSRGRK
ncbi:TPA: hypothetical protein HA318_00345 [Candidatus Micrarchaeota archaeon]|nr:hypothetical protein [Candidatus Micrarchaeota archaeon]